LLYHLPKWFTRVGHVGAPKKVTFGDSWQYGIWTRIPSDSGLIYKEARKKARSLSLSTVYATLNELSRLGIIKMLEFVLAHPDRYEEVVQAAVQAKAIQPNQVPPTFDKTFVIALLMALARQIPQATASMKAGKWEKKQVHGYGLERILFKQGEEMV
jgi:hypothetical protein